MDRAKVNGVELEYGAPVVLGVKFSSREFDEDAAAAEVDEGDEGCG
jgi:hypothetical protein